MKNDLIYSERELKEVILPLAKKITRLYNEKKTVFVGIQGGQGTGKTTLVHFLKAHLQATGYKVKSFSIDDFYTSSFHRQRLANTLIDNPFYQIRRGMPGTHRVKVLNNVLKKAKQGKSFIIPIFDKSLNRAWGDLSKKKIKAKGKQDFILFEGWCLGMPYLSSEEFIKFCKKKRIALKKIDPELNEHKIVLKEVKSYQKLWKYLNYLVMLKPDSIKSHHEWRKQQEVQLRRKTKRGMTEEEINHFVEVFLPFTYLCYETVKPDFKILINKNHKNYLKL